MTYPYYIISFVPGSNGKRRAAIIGITSDSGKVLRGDILFSAAGFVRDVPPPPWVMSKERVTEGIGTGQYEPTLTNPLRESAASCPT